jgi:LemA protein
MTKGSKLWIIFGVIVVGIGMLVLGSYNNLIGAQETVKNKWADVQAQYQRRIDLIPNLMETVKGSAEFEQKTLQAVVEARSAWAKSLQSGSINEGVQAASGFDSALSRLLVTVEAYPQLKSTEAYRDFMTQQEGTENRVAVARRDFNDAVRGYNVFVRRFPSNIVANIFEFKVMESFQAEEGSEKAPEVEFTK